jgi:hypothetical protein
LSLDKFERYDHLICGWWRATERYATHLGGPPAVMFVCRSDDSAREFCRMADLVVTACHAYGGEPASQWIFAARGRMLFATAITMTAIQPNGPATIAKAVPIAASIPGRTKPRSPWPPVQRTSRAGTRERASAWRARGSVWRPART